MSRRSRSSRRKGSGIVEPSKRELPGRYYHPLLATLITGAARLMLALTERLAFEHGLNWAFCDTDSMAFANTEKLPFDEFVGRVQNICDWFVPLNPYEADPKKGPVSILEMEDENFRPRRARERVRTAVLFRHLREAIRPLQPGRARQDRHPQGVGARPRALRLRLTETRRKTATTRQRRQAWEEDVWKQIVSAALGDKPREVDYAFRREMMKPAHSRYGATRPAVLNWFKRYNEGRPYAEQVKPFNFLLTFFARRQEDMATEDPTHEWDPKLEDCGR